MRFFSIDSMLFAKKLVNISQVDTKIIYLIGNHFNR